MPYDQIESTLAGAPLVTEKVEYDFLINATGPKLNFEAEEREDWPRSFFEAPAFGLVWRRLWVTVTSACSERFFFMTQFFRTLCLAVCGFSFLVFGLARLSGQQPAIKDTTSQAERDIPSAQLLQPSELVAMLNAKGGERPVILQVGSHVLYAEAHIPGSEYVGPGGEAPGIQTLRDRVKTFKRDQLLVLYCGCCPWGRCPNIRPAYKELRSLGFTRLKVLYLEQNFGVDWVDKGYPVAKGR